MINVKDAVRAAVAFAEDLYGPREHVDVTVEEVERTEDDRYWLITLGFARTGTALLLMSDDSHRDYKRFTVDGATAQVTSMKIRSIA